ncbi:MAG: hypothetical protein D8M57_01340 [Candidatus Scalindua sp. AMX11]|nr:MAG: hypothetical protein DWQ00_15320 [Candidatus Scalindua sp.]NOG85033.1 hypothetical protein [Planctomycetota bacterium]RZV93084.1 MAG: hypothetical protein EX341_04255 [Candidatus Scalindua sp. SCAELEC01]TDE66710.1 MAG: hypothetical protein D8M57_01340 [Candidatus Scalindua sp. AMX11]GJQ58017.1 MAG: hypothetical protein SCALA701_08180 [Candidatus Scalindua sp.]
MNYPLITVITILGVSLSIASCKKSEEEDGARVENIQTEVPVESDLAKAMKESSRVMKRLERAVKHNDWVEIEMWSQEIKEGIGGKCVELYKAENKWFASKFVILHEKFASALDTLILCSQEQNSAHLNREFNRLTESCDECHEIFHEEDED